MSRSTSPAGYTARHEPVPPDSGEEPAGFDQVMLFQPELCRVHVKLSGEMNLRNADLSMRAMMDHPDWKTGTDVLLDLCEANLRFDGYMEMRSLIEVWKEDLKRLGPGFNAFYSDRPVVRNIAKVILIMGGVFSRRKSDVFATEADAVDWLDRMRASAPR